MPTVSLYGPPRVATEALPDARAHATETPASAGVDLANAEAAKWGAVGRLGGAATEVADTWLEHQNQVAALDADNQRTDLMTKLKYDEGGAFSVKGIPAIGNVDTVLGKYDEGVATIASTLSNGRQREMFGRASDLERTNLHLDLERYAHAESQNADDQTTSAAVTNKGESAISNALDPGRATQDLVDQAAILDQAAKRMGWSPEVLALKKEQASTAAEVIKRVIDEGNLPAAQAYYKLYGPGTPEDPGQNWIKGEKLGQIEKLLREGSVRAESIAQANKIIADGGTYGEQITRAAAIADPQVHDSVITRIKQNDEINQRDARERHETTMKTSVYDMLDATGGKGTIPVSVRGTMTGAERKAADDYAENLLKGIAPEANGATFYQRFSEATYSPATFATRNLYVDKAAMTDGEFKQLLEVRKSIVDGNDRKLQEQTAGFRTNDDILKDTLSQYPELFPNHDDKDQTPAERNALAVLRGQLDRAVVGFEQDHPGKKATPVDKQQLLDAIITRTVTQKTPASWFRDLTTTAPNVGTFWNPAIQETRPVLGLKIGDVPAEARAQIEASIKGHGLTPTDNLILNAYIAQQYPARRPK